MILQRNRARCAASLGVLALLVQAWLPLVHHPTTLFASDGDERAAFERFFGDMPLCIASDTVEHSVPPADKAPVHCPLPCLICQTLHALGSFVAPTLAALALPSVVFERYRLWPDRPRCRVRIHLGARPRGPPPA
jgi:hypothetical protein